MGKRRTSINIDEDVWKAWLIFVVNKHGSTHKVSAEMAIALQEYMEKHG